MHITLKAVPSGDFVVRDGVLPVHGSPLWSRADWLESGSVEKAAEVAAAECRAADIDPVVIVGGSASGYASLKARSGVTDFPGVIKGFPWDVFGNYLKQFYSQPAPAKVEAPVEHIYGEGQDDSLVEEAAIRGDSDALQHVIAVAAGDDHHRAARAKSILAQVPQAVLEAWEDSHKA